MKIIKEGQLPEKKVFRATCRNCETEFEFEQGEAEYKSDQRDGDFLQIACPLCRKTVTVDVRR